MIAPPLTQTVQHLHYAGQERDSRGNVVDTWADPVELPAFFHTGPTHEPQIALHDRVRVDGTVYVSTSVEIDARDKFILPGHDGEFAVEGEVEDYNHGPFGWVPGLWVINVKKVTG